MDQDLQNRLRRLGVTRGARDLKKVPRIVPRDEERQAAGTDIGIDRKERSLEKLFPGGRLEETADGACFIVDRVYPLTYQHGDYRLESLLDYSPKAANCFQQRRTVCCILRSEISCFWIRRRQDWLEPELWLLWWALPSLNQWAGF